MTQAGDTPLLDDTTTVPSGPRGELPDPQLPRYELVEEVGRGGMGRVLAARDQELLRDVAIKSLRREGTHDRDRFEIEARITGQLDHPGVLPVYDYGVDELGNPFFTMKLIREHTSLADVIDVLIDRSPGHADWTFKRRVQVIQKVCQALHYAHERGVLHRDLKPANVVVGRFGEVYLVDWGVARLETTDADGSVQVGDHEQLREREAKAIAGTPCWMAPEQIGKGETSPQTDLYSLSALLYELLALRHYLPSPRADVLSLRDQITRGRPEPAESFSTAPHGRVPRSLSRICAKGLAKEPAHRYQTARELEHDLQLWLEGKAPMVCPGTCMQRGLNAWVERIDQRPVLLPGALLVAAALALAWVVYATWFVLSA